MVRCRSDRSEVGPGLKVLTVAWNLVVCVVLSYVVDLVSSGMMLLRCSLSMNRVGLRFRVMVLSCS